MRRSVILAAIVAAAVPLGAAQKETRPGTMKKGDPIGVRGCLTGGALEVTDLGSTETTTGLTGPTTFRLTGDKKLLKQMRDDHDGKLVDVEGVLKSDLTNQTVQSRKIGRMRITIGAPPAQPGSPDAEARKSLPVLEVRAFTGSTTSCRG